MIWRDQDGAFRPLRLFPPSSHPRHASDHMFEPPSPPTNKQNGTNRNETKTKRTAPPDQNSEAANARRFAALYCPLLPEIVVPEMYDSYTTAR